MTDSTPGIGGPIAALIIGTLLIPALLAGLALASVLPVVALLAAPVAALVWAGVWTVVLLRRLRSRRG